MSLTSLAARWHGRKLAVAGTGRVALDEAPDVAPADNTVQAEMLTRYMPAETVTLYIGAMAAKAEIAAWFGMGVWGIYWVFAALTPILFLMAYLGNGRGNGGPLRLPWWPLVASFLAFLAWGLSVPGNPFADEAKALPAFFALFVSILLSKLEPFFASRQ